MSYSTKTLSVLGYANGITLWHYATPDAAKQVRSAGYFNDAAEMLRAGDFILANCGQQRGTMDRQPDQPVTASSNHIFVVAMNQHGRIELADLSPAAHEPEAA